MCFKLVTLREGHWLTVGRLRVYPLLLLAFALVAAVWLVAAADGRVDAFGRPLGSDFMGFYAASWVLLDQGPAMVYDGRALQAAETAVAGREVPFYTFVYPPLALLVFGGLALLPYGAAFLAWMGASGGLFAAVFHRLVPHRRALWLVLCFPAVFVTLAHGQNAFLSAALLCGLLLLIDRRPFIAGLVGGLLIFKPHLGLLLPVAFVAGRRWTAVAGAAVSVLAAGALSLLLFGPEAWAAFDAKSAEAGRMLREGLVDWGKMVSVYAGLRVLGLPDAAGWVGQAMASLMAATAAWRAWRQDWPLELRGAVLAAGTVLATPFVFDYDLMLLAPAIGLLAVHGLRSGFAPWQVTALAAAYAVPLLHRPAALSLHLPLAPVVVALLLWTMVRRPRA